MRIVCREAAAATAVGTDLMQGNPMQVAGMYRNIDRVGVTGSNAVGAAEVEIFLGMTSIGKFRNSTLGAVDPVDYKDMMPTRSTMVAEPGEPIRVIITVVSAANPIVVVMETRDINLRR